MPLSLLIARFDSDPDDVSDILDLQPTSVTRKDTRSTSGTSRLHNVWHLAVSPDQLFDGGEHFDALSALIGLLRGREQRFLRLHSQLHPEIACLQGGLHFKADQQCGVWLEPEQMRVLVDCQLGWGLDVYAAE
jgi:hypothetical protein